jgi:hypothetical protein
MIVPVTVTASACVVVVRPLVCVEPVCANASGAISAQQARVTIFLFILIPLFMFMNRDNPQRWASQVTNRKACVTKWRHPRAMLQPLSRKVTETSLCPSSTGMEDKDHGTQ